VGDAPGGAAEGGRLCHVQVLLFIEARERGEREREGGGEREREETEREREREREIDR